MVGAVSVLGTGGHAKVVIATAQSMGVEVVAAYDDDSSKHGQMVLGVPIVGPLKLAQEAERAAVLAIGSNRARHQLAASLDCQWATLIHATAIVHDSVQLGAGCVVMAGVVIQPDSVIGDHVIINTGASIDHDASIGDCVHIAPRATLCGNVHVGSGTLVAVGSSLIPGVRVGTWSVVAAGAAVTKSFGSDALIVGVPAQLKEQKRK